MGEESVQRREHPGRCSPVEGSATRCVPRAVANGGGSNHGIQRATSICQFSFPMCEDGHGQSEK